MMAALEIARRNVRGDRLTQGRKHGDHSRTGLKYVDAHLKRRPKEDEREFR